MVTSTSPASHAETYAASKSTAEHLGVIADRVQDTGKHGDFAVFTSLQAVVSNLGRMISQDSLSHTDAMDFVTARQRLESLTQPYQAAGAELPSEPANVMLLGTMMGVNLLLDQIIEGKAQR